MLIKSCTFLEYVEAVGCETGQVSELQLVKVTIPNGTSYKPGVWGRNYPSGSRGRGPVGDWSKAPEADHNANNKAIMC